MSKHSHLDIFIKDSFTAGQDRDSVYEALVQAGWEEKKIDQALSGYHFSKDFPLPIPKPQVFASARLLFLNLFYFKIFYIIIYCTLSIYFDMVDFYVGADDFTYRPGNLLIELVKYPLSILVFSLPILFLTKKLISASMRNSKQSIPKMRLFLVYFTLATGACVMFSTGCWLIWQFISGTVTITSLIKIALMAITVTLLYFYFRTDLLHDEKNA